MTAADRFSEIKNRITEYVRQDDAVRSVIAIGSSTRSETPADEYSDLDLIIVTEKPEPWFSGAIPERMAAARAASEL